jgi:putative colanic acid biosynthesis acetyltransferase WcaF
LANQKNQLVSELIEGFAEMMDVEKSRNAQKWTGRQQVGRVVWAVARPAFFFSPRVGFRWWRSNLLRLFGARIGTGVFLHPTVKITMPWNLQIGDQVTIGDGVKLYALGLISIGARSTISQGVHLCAGSHDWRDPAMPLLKLPIVIGEDVWVCADAFVGPNVSIGSRAIIGARSVVMKSVEPGVLGHGNPFRISRKR